MFRLSSRITTPDIRPHAAPVPEVGELTALRYEQHGSAGALGPHLHPGQIEICYIDRGRLRWWAGDETFDLVGGDVYVTWPDEVHGGVDDVIAPCGLFWMTLRLPRPGRRFLGLPTDESRALLAALRQLPARRFPAGRGVGPAFAGAWETLDKTCDALGTAVLRGRLVTLLGEIVASARQAPPEAELTQPVLRAQELMQANLADPLTLAEIAECVGWSLSHFKARFRAATGVPPAQQYLRFRVQAAVDRIAATDTGLARIAQQFGFSSGQYLATCVKRMTGRCPSEFRS